MLVGSGPDPFVRHFRLTIPHIHYHWGHKSGIGDRVYFLVFIHDLNSTLVQRRANRTLKER